MSAIRQRLLIVATIFGIALLVTVPTVYESVGLGVEDEALPPRIIAADVASRQTTMPRLNLPEATRPSRLSLRPTDVNGLPGIDASPTSLDDDVFTAIHRNGTYRGSAGAYLLAEMNRQDSASNDFAGGSGYGTESLSAIGSASSSSLESGQGGSASADEGASSSGSVGVGATASLSLFHEDRPVIDLVFVPSKTETTNILTVEPTLEIPREDSVVPSDPESPNQVVGDPPLDFDPEPDPESPAPVPEPATFLLTGLGLGGLIAKARARACKRI
jgi:hypothetical protein